MSRICVKDLPNYVVEDRLREHFSQKGEITDVKLQRNKDGKSRRFAFIGFRTNNEAQEAIRYFNRSYLDMSRITCEVTQKHGSANLPRPRSRHSTKKDNKATAPDANKHAGAKGQGDNSKDIVHIDESPQLSDFIQVMKKSKLWANDTSVVSNVGNNLAISNKEKKSANDKAQVNAAEESGQLPNPEDEKGVFESCQLRVRNLPYGATEEKLEEHFSQFGSVSQVLVVENETRRSTGKAYVHFSAPEFAARALEELDNSSFQGRLLRVKLARQRTSDNGKKNVSMDDGSKTLKQQREEERKASEASGDTRAWNPLFMRPDTAVENIARKYGVSKSDLLDREADDLPVCIALWETQVISETKKAFKNAGVNVESLEELANGKFDGLKRSNHVLLVKNLPYGSTKYELAKMFGRFRSVDKIILPPTKTLALVVFLEAAEAKSAFRGLSYRRFKDAPLYLEWAPSNILSPTSKVNEMHSGIGENDVKRLILEQNVEKISDMDIDRDRIEVTKHLKNGKIVSMGFGFVEFDSPETATNVCSDLQRIVLDGHELILQLCHGKSYGKVQKTVEKDKSCTKLLVKNVAFEATKKDLRQLFSPFGQIKSLRLPLKSKSHKGFAFVEYVTQQEAQNALAALSSTHLYDRHLEIESANKGESLEDKRARSTVQFNENNGYGDANATMISRKGKANQYLR